MGIAWFIFWDDGGGGGGGIFVGGMFLSGYRTEGICEDWAISCENLGKTGKSFKLELLLFCKASSIGGGGGRFSCPLALSNPSFCKIWLPAILLLLY